MTDHTDTACTEPRGPMGPALAKALLSARGEFPAVTKSKTARIRTKTGGEYSYTYADLPAMLETYLPVLSRHGILLVYGAEPAGGGAAHLSATLIHVESGDSYTATLPLPADDDPKVQGARLTYLRRYLTNIVLGTAPDSDDDATAVSETVADRGAKPSGREQVRAKDTSTQHRCPACDSHTNTYVRRTKGNDKTPAHDAVFCSQCKSEWQGKEWDKYCYPLSKAAQYAAAPAAGTPAGTEDLPF